MTKKLLIRSLCALLLLFSVAPFAAAQEIPPKLSEVWVLEIKPGAGEAFRAGIGAHMAFRQEQGDPRAWQAYVPLLGDELNRFAVRYCCFEWADVDAYRAWDSNNPEVGAHYVEHIAPHVAGAAHYFETIDWANSHWGEAGGPYRLFAVNEFHVQPDNADDFDEARVKMSQIAIEQGWAADGRDWLWMTRIGAAPVRSVVVPHRNFASLDDGRGSFADFLAAQMGSADKAAELMHQFTGAFEGSSYQIWEHQPELSMPERD